MLEDLLVKLTKEEIIALAVAYNDYLFVDHEDEISRMDRAPVCLAEFYDCEYQEIVPQ